MLPIRMTFAGCSTSCDGSSVDSLPSFAPTDIVPIGAPSGPTTTTVRPSPSDSLCGLAFGCSAIASSSRIATVALAAGRSIGHASLAIRTVVRRPLLGERTRALGRLGRVYEQLQPVERQARDATDVIGVGVERVLEEAERGGRIAGDLATPRERGRQQFVGRNDRVDETPALRGRGID